MTGFPYRGRFAPSPTGPLHFGSLVAAVGSYLDAKAEGGEWLVRIEDVDQPRTVAGAADAILRTLDALGVGWDGEVLYQSRRDEAYRAALADLERSGMVYPCACSRKDIADSSFTGPAGLIYPGTCRPGLPPGRSGRAVRLRVEGEIAFADRLQGEIRQDLEREVGDFVLRRADGLFAYQLAVVVDDAEQGITHVVRGADLLDSTPRQIYLQGLLGLAVPSYLHLPVAVNQRREKLSKQTLAPEVDLARPAELLCRVLRFLDQEPPPGLEAGGLEACWTWAVSHWRPERLAGVLTRSAGDPACNGP